MSKISEKRIFSPIKFLVLFMSLWVNSATAQILYKGKVIDAQSKEPLAFVNVSFNNGREGALSDIDGYFEIKANKEVTEISFSYVGYNSQSITLKAGELNIIKLKRSAVSLKEVEIKPGENPAEIIIARVIANKKINDPEKRTSFSYDAYNKMYFTAEENKLKTDSLAAINDSAKTDSMYIKLKRFVDRQHLFLMETVSQTKFLYPDKKNEIVLAQRVSGFKDPSFLTLFMQMQTFGFYKETIAISDKNYINPIADNAIDKYLYIIEDTLMNGKDSVFLISFRPRRLKHFESLKGLLYINTNRYAIQNVIAEPFEQDNGTNIKVQQQYEFIDGKYWFPVQLNTDVIYKQIMLGNAPAAGIGRNYLRNIKFDEPMRKKDFSELAVQTDKDANNKDEDFWNTYRKDSLNKKELRTYHIIDSVGKKEHFERKIKAAEALFTNKIPIKFVDLDLKSVLAENDYEGFRLGLGLSTNNRVSRKFSIGGYFAYGFADKAFKYGGNLDIFLNVRNELKISSAYRQDVFEVGGVNFLNNSLTLNSSELYRRLLIRRMDSVQIWTQSVSARIFKYLKLNAYYNIQNRISTDGYRFVLPHDSYQTTGTNHFSLYETGMQFYYAYNEKFINIGRAFISQGTRYPTLYLNLVNGMMQKPYSQNYFKADWRIEKAFDWKKIGRTKVTAQGGFVNAILPYGLLYNGIGSYSKFSLVSANTFQTAGVNEFVLSNYEALFISHRIGRLFYRFKKFQPVLSLEHNMGVGSLNSSLRHKNITFNTMEKGFFESGFVLDNLIKSGFSGFGLGCYYRYGPYASKDPVNNLAVKLSLTIGF